MQTVEKVGGAFRLTPAYHGKPQEVLKRLYTYESRERRQQAKAKSAEVVNVLKTCREVTGTSISMIASYAKMNRNALNAVVGGRRLVHDDEAAKLTEVCEALTNLCAKFQ